MNAVEIMEALNKYGPWAIITFLGLAVWYKDKQLMKEVAKSQEITKQLMTVIESKTQTDTKMEGALNGLKEVIMILVNHMH
jgi:hypothetical protein